MPDKKNNHLTHLTIEMNKTLDSYVEEKGVLLRSKFERPDCSLSESQEERLAFLHRECDRLETAIYLQQFL